MPRHGAILARLRIQDAPLGGGRLLAHNSTASNEGPGSPASGRAKPLLLADLTPRTDRRAELGHPCAPLTPNHARRLKWLRLHAQNWLCFAAQYQFSTTPVSGGSA